MTTVYVLIAAFLALGVMAFFVYRAGKKRQRGENAEDQLNAVRRSHEVEDDVRRMSDDDVNKRLRKWDR